MKYRLHRSHWYMLPTQIENIQALIGRQKESHKQLTTTSIFSYSSMMSLFFDTGCSPTTAKRNKKFLENRNSPWQSPNRSTSSQLLITSYLWFRYDTRRKAARVYSTTRLFLLLQLLHHSLIKLQRPRIDQRIPITNRPTVEDIRHGAFDLLHIQRVRNLRRSENHRRDMSR